MASPTPPNPPGPTRPPATESVDTRATNRVTKTVAWIAVAGVLLGGLVAAASSYMTARIQVSSQSEQATNEFRRTQSRDAYVKILSDLTAVESVEEGVNKPNQNVVYYYDGTAFPPEFVDKLAAALDQLDRSIAESRIVSTEEVYDAALAIRLLHEPVYQKIRDYNYQFSIPGTARPSAQDALSDLSALIRVGPLDDTDKFTNRELANKIRAAKEDFISKAKADIDLN